MTDKEMFKIFDGMEQVNREMADRIEAAAPTCHFRKMGYDVEDSTDGSGQAYWECSTCGHTKPAD